MSLCSRTLCALTLLIVAGAVPAQENAGVERPLRWEVTFALRIPAGATPVDVRLALPSDGADLTIENISVKSRGLKAEVVAEGDDPHVRITGDGKEARRIAVTYDITKIRRRLELPPVRPLEYPPAELLPYLEPSPLFQSRSILVRGFLEEYAAPRIEGATADYLRPILEATRAQLRHSRKGKTLALDVLRSRRAKRIGMERALCTFMRCARVPARFVEGIDLRRSTSRKRVFWTEVWAQDAWWPASASRNWIGRMPSGYVALARDGRRVIEQQGDGRVEYRVIAHRIDPVREEPTP